jgi:hypothetical protein
MLNTYSQMKLFPLIMYIYKKYCGSTNQKFVEKAYV